METPLGTGYSFFPDEPEPEPLELTAEELLRHLERAELARSIAEANRLSLLAQYAKVRAREGALAERSVPDEVALALHIGRGHAVAQLDLARNLVERLPSTMDALWRGQVDLSKARALVEVTALMSVEDARTVEAKVLPNAESRTLAQVRASARYHRDRTDPKAAEARRQRAQAERTAWFTPGEDGDGVLCVRGPGERVYLAWLVIDTQARKIRDAGDDRSLEAIRHDLMVDAVLGKFTSRIQVHAYLHVPATTVAGISDDPGILAGYGAVTAEACRELANGSAIWRRVFTDPLTGTVKDVDRRTYRPPNALAEYIAVRDGTCSAPGCLRDAHSCQVDHTVAWAQGGCTCEDNLGTLCWSHHRLKTLCGWSLQQPKPGYFVWRSPVGQRFEKLPGSILNP
jgi:hypothetical protein